jgi:hypothetical protein
MEPLGEKNTATGSHLIQEDGPEQPAQSRMDFFRGSHV